MSNIPDFIRAKGGFKTQRDDRNKNIRLDCLYCSKKGLLFTSYGSHMVKEHLDEMFKMDSKSCKENLNNLYKNKYFTEPIPVDCKGTDYYWCFGCYTCFKNNKTALNHFEKKRCLARNKDILLSLRNAYPKDLTCIQKSVFPNKSKLEFFLTEALERVRFLEKKSGTEKWDYESQYSRYFEEWGMALAEENLTVEELPPSCPPECDENKEEVQETMTVIEEPLEEEKEEEELLTFVVPKTPSKEEQLLKLLEDPGIDEASKNALRQELKICEKKPPPPAPLPPSVDDRKAELERQIAELDAERKKTPWQRFIDANPGLSVQERITRASVMGIRPDGDSALNIVSNTKAKRKAKQCDA